MAAASAGCFLGLSLILEIGAENAVFRAFGFGARLLASLLARPAARRLLGIAVGVVEWSIAGAHVLS